MENAAGADVERDRSVRLARGRAKEELLGEGMGAVIAAVYLEAECEAVSDTVIRLWGSRSLGVEADAREPKTGLQEWAQARGQKPPAYETVSREGPDHAPVFTIRVVLDNGASEAAKAKSKRQAEQAAAKALLARLGQ